ncbi:39S ribosomal protein L55, mitochondrial [Thrips palmi]|uniref:39S ribosomal protein L55, mitochondrial n=1 Tax=Thrips palmi TaxID=161013 RepID=A0A6P8YRK4_THRPL|nr:39S ribosomal protein L55, mitochondrial [Thrips palmi]
MISSNLLIRMRAGHQWAAAKCILSSPLSSLNKLCARGLSNNLALVTKIHRESFLRTYPTLVVQADGSSFYIRYQEPRSIIQLPLDVSTLTPEELKIRLAKRNPKKKVVYAKEEEDTYQASKYIRLVKKAKKAAVKN